MRLLGIVLALVLGPLLYLVVAPTPVQPVAWQPKPAPKFEGAFASNGALERIETLLPELAGPEALVADARGRLTTGLRDGRIVRLNPGKLRFKELGNTGGRPLGMKLTPEGFLIIADADKGLLQLDQDGGAIKTLASSYQGRAFRLVDDVDLLPDGTILFTDASTRFGLDQFDLDVLEHSATGRLFAFDPSTQRLSLLKDGLVFANGVAVSGDGTYALVCETAAYRVRRVFVNGPRKGQSDVFIDNLPGFPDNISYDRERDLFWLALVAPRNMVLDLLAPFPFLRRMVGRLPEALRPRPARHAMALAIDGNGKVVKFMDDPRAESYSPLTSVTRIGNTLYFGSYEHAGIGRMSSGAL